MKRVGRPSAKQRKPYNPDAILDVAVRVFREHGYDGSTLDDVAQAAGITKASIYYHVRSKEELLARGVGRALDALFAVLDERPAKRGRPRRASGTSCIARLKLRSINCPRSHCCCACAAILRSSGESWSAGVRSTI